MPEGLRTFFNNHLDKIVRAEFHLPRRSRPAFQVCGCTGLVLALILAMSLTTYLGLSPLVMTAIAVVAALTFLGLVMATKIITGQERIIYYHHEIAVLCVTALLVYLLGEPVLPYLDVTILGVGLFLTCGRVGCLMVGCCHGRLSRWGVRYREEHAEAGFIRQYVGVRLFPVQALESAWVLSVVLAGIMLIVSGRPAGAALAWYVVAYDAARFCFEFLRGDPERPYYWGFSQPQWISLLLMCAVVWGEFSGVLALQPWHVFATSGLALAMVAIALKRRFQRVDKHRLLHPNHVREVASALESFSEPEVEAASGYPWTSFPTPARPAIRVGFTSLGVLISADNHRPPASDIYHYAISFRHGGMTEEVARIIAQVIVRLDRAEGGGELLEGNRGVFHLLIHPAGEKELAR